MVSWLDADTVVGVLGDDIGAGLDLVALQAACDGARDFVEDKRPDLWVPGDPLAEPPTEDTYTPPPRVIHGAALLAYRFYSRRSTPLGVLGFTEDGAAGIMRFDPDIQDLLGIGRARTFRFGGAPPVVETEV